MKALEELVNTVRRRDAEGFQLAHKRLQQHIGNISEEDFNKAFEQEFKNDKEGVEAFLKEHCKMPSPFRAVEVNTVQTYYNFRKGGLAYGPEGALQDAKPIQGRGSEHRPDVLQL